MISKLRTLTIITYLFTLSLFGFVSLSALFFDVDFILGIITGLIFLVLIFVVFKYFSVIEIRHKQNKIILQNPLQLKKIELDFSEIIGYNFFVLSAKSHDYIGLKIITSEHIYYLSDFETKNFHLIENEFIKYFKLIKKGSFGEESNEQKFIEINRRNEVKKNQKKEIKSILEIFKYLSLFMVLASIVDYIIYKTINSGKITFFTISILLVVYTFYKLNVIKNSINHK
jgi:Na+/melibiose symporter-like transporter